MTEASEPLLFKPDASGRRKALLVDTIPHDARNRGSINLGMEIVRAKWDADVCHYRDDVDIRRYERVGFNVFYPTHMLNVVPFLRRHKIEKGRGPRLVAGGQGVGTRGALLDIVDEVVCGEIDAECADEIVSAPVHKYGKAVIELSRGCLRKCAFCEYAHNRPVRFKPLSLVKDQIDEMCDARIRRINFMSTDFAGYPHFDDLMEHVILRGVQVLNGDYCVNSMTRALRWLKYLPRQMKLGVESWDQKVRASVGKPVSDDMLEHVILQSLETAFSLHFYLIYGLPGDDYRRWSAWLDRLAVIRDTAHTKYENDLFGDEVKVNRKDVRFEFNLTNFEPCDGTPLASAPEVDFTKKDEFIRMWSSAMIRNGLFTGERMDYVNGGGRLGRKELSYRMLMMLKRGGRELKNCLTTALPKGVSRSISDAEAQAVISANCAEAVQ